MVLVLLFPSPFAGYGTIGRGRGIRGLQGCRGVGVDRTAIGRGPSVAHDIVEVARWRHTWWRVVPGCPLRLGNGSVARCATAGTVRMWRSVHLLWGEVRMLSVYRSNGWTCVVVVWTTVGIVSSAVVVRVLGIVFMLCFLLTRSMAHLLVSLAVGIRVDFDVDVFSLRPRPGRSGRWRSHFVFDIRVRLHWLTKTRQIMLRHILLGCVLCLLLRRCGVHRSRAVIRLRVLIGLHAVDRIPRGCGCWRAGHRTSVAQAGVDGQRLGRLNTVAHPLSAPFVRVCRVSDNA